MTTTIPDTVEGLEDVLADPTKLSAYFEDGKPKAEFGELVRGYVAKSRARDESVEDAITDGIAKGLTEFLATAGQAGRKLNLDPRSAPPRFAGTTRAQRYASIYNSDAPGAKADGIVEKWGQFARATWHNAGTAKDGADLLAIQHKLSEVRNSFGSLVPADGGFLVPETLRAEVLSVALEAAFMRPRSMVVPMESLRVPFPTIDSVSNASSVHGGIVAYWTEEGAELADSAAKFGRVVLEAKKLTAMAEVPNELYSDAALALGAFIDKAFPEAVAFFEDVAFIGGSGVGEPLGWNTTGNDALVTVAKESGQAADTLLWENIVKMYARMLPGSLGRAIWVAHIDTFPELATMALSVGTGGGPIWITNGADGAPMTILGRPVYFTEKMETLGDAGDLAFVDPSYYLVGDRMTMQVSQSAHAKFTSDRTVVKFVQRVDGAPWLKSAITPHKGANTLSPYVRLAARA